jgi:hypothetical protein
MSNTLIKHPHLELEIWMFSSKMVTQDFLILSVCTASDSYIVCMCGLWFLYYLYVRPLILILSICTASDSYIVCMCGLWFLYCLYVRPLILILSVCTASDSYIVCMLHTDNIRIRGRTYRKYKNQRPYIQKIWFLYCLYVRPLILILSVCTPSDSYIVCMYGLWFLFCLYVRPLILIFYQRPYIQTI